MVLDPIALMWRSHPVRRKGGADLLNWDEPYVDVKAHVSG
jgi:hypothetical protein